MSAQDLGDFADVAPDSDSRPITDLASLEAWISEWVAAKVGIPASEIDRDAYLVELGLDSLTALEFSGCLELALQREVSPTVALEHPSIAAIAAFFSAQFAEVAEPLQPL